MLGKAGDPLPKGEFLGLYFWLLMFRNVERSYQYVFFNNPHISGRIW